MLLVRLESMETIHQQFDVHFEYPVVFTTDVFDVDNGTFVDVLTAGDDLDGTAEHSLLVAIDDGVVEHHPDAIDSIERYCTDRSELDLVCEPLVVPGGERAKNGPEVVDRIHRRIDRHGLGRHAFVVAVGGGAVLDAVGYAAGTAHRGVRHIRLPTTVLSQNDSGVGVKNGINAFGKKNFLGTFTPPYAVVNDFEWLTTLSDRDWRGGISEAVKVSLLKDAEFFDFLEEHAEAFVQRELEPMKRLVRRCAELHLEHIATSGDPFEFGSSRPLDFGHWAAHKLEQLTDYELRHGEAVAVGLALDATYAHLAGMLDEEPLRRVLELFRDVRLPVYVSELRSDLETPSATGSLFAGLDEFREHLGGELTIMLLEGIGRGTEVHDIDNDLVREAIERLEEFASNQGDSPWKSSRTPAR